MTRANQLTDPITDHGEGPVWWPDGHLRLVDMLAGDIVDLFPDGTIARTHVDAVAAVVRPRSSGGAVVATERGIVLIDEDGTSHAGPTVLWSDPTVRMNEGSCDAHGRFYCGSMAYDAAPGRGRLYRFDSPDDVTVALETVTISNGLAFCDDDSTAFYVDTPTRRIDRFDHHADGTLNGRRLFAELDAGAGDPDGIVLDRDGGIWVACWGGNAVRHFDAAGRLDEVIEVPAANVTACTLGGPGLTTLYITTSRVGVGTDYATPAGAVFVVPDVPPGLAALPCRF